MGSESAGESAAKPARIGLRTTEDVKNTIEHAAALRGLSLTQFILAAATDEAHRVTQEFQSVRLRGQQSLAFTKAVMEPLPAAYELVELFRGEE